MGGPAARSAHRNHGTFLVQLRGSGGEAIQRNRNGTRDVAKGACELIGLAHIHEDRTVLLDRHVVPADDYPRLRIEVPDAAARQGRDASMGASCDAGGRLAPPASQVSGASFTQSSPMLHAWIKL